MAILPRLPSVSHDYELHYFYRMASEPVIDKARCRDDSEASMRAIRGLLQMPSRHAVQVWKDDVVVFSRSRNSQ